MPEAVLVVAAVVLVVMAAALLVVAVLARRAASTRRLSRLTRTLTSLHQGVRGGRRIALREPLPTVRPVEHRRPH